MSYQHERDTFIMHATREGLDMQTMRKLLRYASTLHRLAEAQCNGDWPYNGDRDRPANNPSISAERNAEWRARWDARYTVCPNCEASGVAKSAMRNSTQKTDAEDLHKTGNRWVKVCPDCRTQELVRATLANVTFPTLHGGDIKGKYVAVFNGDPRGAVLVLSTPGFPYDATGKNGARGLYVPVR